MEKSDIVKILMKRDHMTLDDAWDIINETQEEVDYIMNDADPAIFAAEDLIKRNLNLGPEYLDAFYTW